MANITDAELDRGAALGSVMLAGEPQAVSARYEVATGRIVIELRNGCSYAFPARFLQDFQNVDAAALSGVEVDGLGFNLHWPALDVDLYVPALVAGIFGTTEWMKRGLARLAGQATSPAKQVAARANGAKGGRPRKLARGAA